MLTEFITNFDEWLSHLSIAYPIGVYVVFFSIVFFETAFFPVAPVLPGDGLLFLIGILAASGSVSFWIAVMAVITGGTLGNLLAYKLGVLVTPTDGGKIRWLKQEHYAKAQKFYDRYGVRALFYSRFIPVVRAIVPLIAGITLMDYGTFAKYSFVSVTLWVLFIMTTAFYLGQIPWIKNNFTIMILLFTFLSVLPIFIVWIKIKLNLTISKRS